MVMLEAAKRRARTESAPGDLLPEFAGHPHFGPDAVEQRRRTHARLRGGPATDLHGGV